MDKEVLEEGNKTPEGRLKILEIKSLIAKNRLLSTIGYTSVLLWLYIGLNCTLTVFCTIVNDPNLKAKYPLLSVLLTIIATKILKHNFLEGITADQQYNNEEIVRLENEILNSKEKN